MKQVRLSEIVGKTILNTSRPHDDLDLVMVFTDDTFAVATVTQPYGDDDGHFVGDDRSDWALDRLPNPKAAAIFGDAYPMLWAETHARRAEKEANDKKRELERDLAHIRRLRAKYPSMFVE
jgi:hypothetical protein